ncbi:flagellar hook-associated protein FlgL [bacterium]|nr:flagellar hook-associated protein FlgL [bacterium]
MLTRTTSSQMSDSLVKYMASTQGKFNKLSTQLATQKKITSITDDAVAAKSILNAKKEINLYNGYIQNMKNSQYELKAVEDTMKSANTQASRALDVGMMASNGTYSETEMSAFKQEVDGIIKTMTSLANSKYDDAYLFSGTAALKMPYDLEPSAAQTFTDNGDGTYTKSVSDDDGNITTYTMVNSGTTETPSWQTTITNPDGTQSTRTTTSDDWKIENSTTINYNGTSDAKTIVIGAGGLEETVGVLGTELFGKGTVTTTSVFDPDAGKSTSTVELDGDGGMLTSLSQLSAAIGAGDTDAINSALSGIQKGLDNLAESKATVGLSSGRFDTLMEAYDNNVLNLTSLKSSLEDADLTSLIAEWLQSQYALEASYALSSQMMSVSIMNYI